MFALVVLFDCCLIADLSMLFCDLFGCYSLFGFAVFVCVLNFGCLRVWDGYCFRFWAFGWYLCVLRLIL